MFRARLSTVVCNGGRQYRLCIILQSIRQFSSSSFCTSPSTAPARTRFAPSPTGYLHWGSLRTALYNYLLAKSTGGTFILRLEDTDRSRLVPDAEKSIYETLEWCGMKIDEGPHQSGPYGPYRQSDRQDIYKHYANILLRKGLAYKCFCSKNRLADLRQSAMRLSPPTTVTYDRKCLTAVPDLESNNVTDYVIRFKSPDSYSPFSDLLHGSLDLQPQYNENDRRYDDIVLLKSDGMPTYHFANVIDDHLMKISHVIRGEEWLPSTPRHIAMYKAFGWEPPIYVHIPLLTSLDDKKLSKRNNDKGILSVRDHGILPDAVVNFVALFGWSPRREQHGVKTSECMSLSQIIDGFSLDGLTRGNAKVNESKLYHFNKHHISDLVTRPDGLTELVALFWPTFDRLTFGKYDKYLLRKLLKTVGPGLTTLNELVSHHSYTFSPVNYSDANFGEPNETIRILNALLLSKQNDFLDAVTEVASTLPGVSKKKVFQCVRLALAGGSPGLTLPILIELLGDTEYRQRLTKAIDFISMHRSI